MRFISVSRTAQWSVLGLVAGLSLAGLLLGCSTGAQETAAPAGAEIAPGGTLRFGINLGNALLAGRNEQGMLHGIAVDLATELGRRTGLPTEFITYESAGRMADAVASWDVAFLGADPDRAEMIHFTQPYLEIDTTYLVPAGSQLRTLEDVDRAGIRIAVSDKSAYDLFLSRSLQNATLVRAPSVNASVDLFFAEGLDALAGLRPLLVEVAARQPGARVLDDRFTVVQQAVAVPRGRDAAAQYVSDFVEDIKSSGFLQQVIESNGILGVSVAPPAQ